jgi:hypothetical protein
MLKNYSEFKNNFLNHAKKYSEFKNYFLNHADPEIKK